LSTASHSEIFKIKDATSYDDVSDQFDIFTRVLSQPFAERMVRLAELKAGQRLLDVGTGTGIVAFNAARAMPDIRVVAVDLSDGMLATARQKAESQQAGSIEFRRMDAEALQFDSGSFDVVLSLFALLHFPNPSVALTEMLRVLRPGGRLVLAVGSRPDVLSTATLAQGVGRLKQIVLQQTGRLLVAPAFLDRLVDKHLPGAVHTEASALARTGLNRTAGALSLVRAAGFTNIQTGWHGHQAQLQTPEDFWRIQSTFSSVARKRLASAPEGKVKALREEFFDACRQVMARQGRLVYPMGAFFIKARKPVA
jgi:ubiquinone/menaquinone biosynthesis C-methylase UbiE